MRKFLIGVALLFGVIFLISNFTELEAAVETLGRGDWRYLLLGLGVMLIWVLNIAAVYRAIYQALGVEERIQDLFILAAAASFVNVVTPSGMVGGVSLFIARAKNRKYSAAKATLAGVLFVLFDYASFILVLIIGLIILIRTNNISSAEIIASLILFGVAATLALLLFLGMRSAEEMGSALSWMARVVNRFLKPIIKREYLSEKRGYDFAIEASDGLAELRKKPENLIWPFALTLSSKALMIITLFLVFVAFKVPYSPGTLIAGFSISFLFMIVSPTPAGIGVVEGLLTFTLRQLGVSSGSAPVITLAYRGLTFWFPLLFGMLALRFANRFIENESEL